MLAIKAFSMAHWNLQDDQGLLHHIEIHDAAWVMDLPHTLLSLQTLDLTNKQSLSISSWCMHAAVVKQMQIFLNRGFCQNNPTGSQKRYPLFVFDVRHGKIWFLDKKFQNKYKHQTVIEPLTFASIVLDSEGRMMIHLHIQCHLHPQLVSNSCLLVTTMPSNVVKAQPNFWASSRGRQQGYCLHGHS